MTEARKSGSSTRFLAYVVVLRTPGAMGMQIDLIPTLNVTMHGGNNLSQLQISANNSHMLKRKLKV